MIIEKNVNAIVRNINELYKNSELAIFVINKHEGTVDVAIYDDFRKSDSTGRYLASNELRYTDITIPNIKENDLDRVKIKLEKLGIEEERLYEYELNKTIYQINDVVDYEGDYGVIRDIDRNSTYPYLIAFQYIYKEDVVYWAEDEEIKPVIDKTIINEVSKCYSENKEQIENDLKERDKEMECEI